MARPIVLSNGSLHVGLDSHGLVSDFYYPHVGQENHTAAPNLVHKVGVYAEGKFHWLDDGSWEITTDYVGDVLISRVVAINQDLQVRIDFDDCVDSEVSSLLRNIHVINMGDTEREIRLFMHQVFAISDSNTSDTVQYLPADHVLMHYKGHRVFIVSGAHADTTPFATYTVDQFSDETGAFADAVDGELAGQTVAHGTVDSVIGFHIKLRAHSSQRVHYWIAAGRSEREAKRIHASIQEQGVLHHVLKTANWWAEWVKPTQAAAANIPEAYRKSFIRSALLIKASLDNQGAVIASLDGSASSLDRDTYVYCWPRDAVFALWPLLRLGYTEETLKFFAFARRSLHDDGYLLHKYQADGAVGSSWYGYKDLGGRIAPPIQADETALVLFLFGQYYRDHPEPELLDSFYPTFIKPMASFLSSYIDEDGLPLASYDIWQAKYLTSTFTTAATYASLCEAAFLAKAADDIECATRWQEIANAMYANRDVFYNRERSYFYNGYVTMNGKREFDDTIDSSSLFGVFLFGYFDQTGDRVSKAYETLGDTLMTVGSKVIRYENDGNKNQSSDPHNSWPITSLWGAQYALQTGDTKRAQTVLDWVLGAQETTGAIAEQYDHDDKPVSATPFTWSQAEYMSALLDMSTADEGTA